MCENKVVWHPYPDERPQTEGARYLVTYIGAISGGVYVGTFRYFNDEFSNVLAWAELPSPYRMESNRWIKRLVATVPFTLYGYECPFCKYFTSINTYKFCPDCGNRVKEEE